MSQIANLFGGGGSIVPGTTPISPSINTAVLFDDAGFVGENAGFTFNKTTGLLSAPRATLATGTITTSQPGLTITQTWNAGAVTFNPLLINVTSTASAAASTLIDLQVASVSMFNVTKAGAGIFAGAVTGGGTFVITGSNSTYGTNMTLAGNATLATGSGFYWSDSSNPFSGSIVLTLLKDANNTLAQRNGTTGQTFNLYETFTDASNYGRIQLQSSGPNYFFSTAGTRGAAGTGTNRSIIIDSGGGLALRMQNSNALQIALNDGTVYWSVSGGAGHFLAGTDNTYDIGASGATRPRTGYFGTSVVTPALTISQTPAAVTGAAVTITNAADGAANIGHRVSMNLNGTTYWIPCSSVAF